jgi:hypothetical protein
MAAMLERLSKGWRTALVAAALTIGSVAVAQEFRADHPDTYVVRRGDTLWDIAGKFLRKPWLWPEIWQANPQIRNPHLIYPGDVISLAYLDRVTAQPGPRTDAQPINAIPLSDIEPFLKDLRVVDQFEQLPYVVGLEEDQLRATQGQLVYVRGLADSQPGQRYLVVRPTVRYTRLERAGMCCDLLEKDDLDYRGRRDVDFGKCWNHVVFPDKGGETLGYELQRVNIGTITRGEVGGIEASTVLLDEGGREVRIGDRLIPVDAQPYDLQFFPHPPKQQLAYGRARVLAVTDNLSYGGPRDVVALSVGTADGVDNGTVFSIWREGSNVVDRVEHSADFPAGAESFEGKVRLPDEYAGHVIVFRSYDKVSYGLVMDGTKPTRIGYHLKHPDAAY